MNVALFTCLLKMIGVIRSHVQSKSMYILDKENSLYIVHLEDGEKCIFEVDFSHALGLGYLQLINLITKISLFLLFHTSLFHYHSYLSFLYFKLPSTTINNDLGLKYDGPDHIYLGNFVV